MKKVLIGCGIVFLIGVIAAVGAGYWATGKLRQVTEASKEIAAQYQQTNVDFPFDRPATNAVSDDQIQRWMAVLIDFSPEIQQSLDAQKQAKGLSAVTGMFSTWGQLLKDHVAVLEKHAMSIEEYQWVGRRVISALNSGDALADPELKPLAEKMRSIEEHARQPQQPGDGFQFHSNADLTVPLTSAEIAETLRSLKDHLADLEAVPSGLEHEYIIESILQAIPPMTHGGPMGQNSAAPTSATLPAGATPAAAQ